MNDASNAPIVEDSTVDLVLGGDSPIRDGSAPADTPVLPPVPVLPSESLPSSNSSESTTESVENTTEISTDSVENTTEISTETSTDIVEIPIPSISGNEVVGGSGNLSPSLSGNTITISGNDIADLITSTVSTNNLDKGTLTEEQNLQYITLLETQNGYLSSINTTMSCLLFFTLLTWAVGIIKRITGGFAGYGHE